MSVSCCVIVHIMAETLQGKEKMEGIIFFSCGLLKETCHIMYAVHIGEK